MHGKLLGKTDYLTSVPWGRWLATDSSSVDWGGAVSNGSPEVLEHNGMVVTMYRDRDKTV